MFPWKQLNSNREEVFSVWSEPRCYNRETFRSQLSRKDLAFREVLNPESAIVKSRYQATTSEDGASWKRLSVCSSDLLSVCGN
jgi:hypothetical protein